MRIPTALSLENNRTRQETRDTVAHGNQGWLGHIYFFLSGITTMFDLLLDSFEKHLQFSRFVFSFGLLTFFLKVLRRYDIISHGKFFLD